MYKMKGQKMKKCIQYSVLLYAFRYILQICKCYAAKFRKYQVLQNEHPSVNNAYTYSLALFNYYMHLDMPCKFVCKCYATKFRNYPTMEDHYFPSLGLNSYHTNTILGSDDFLVGQNGVSLLLKIASR